MYWFYLAQRDDVHIDNEKYTCNESLALSKYRDEPSLPREKEMSLPVERSCHNLQESSDNDEDVSNITNENTSSLPSDNKEIYVSTSFLTQKHMNSLALQKAF